MNLRFSYAPLFLVFFLFSFSAEAQSYMNYGDLQLAYNNYHYLKAQKSGFTNQEDKEKAYLLRGMLKWSLIGIFYDEDDNFRIEDYLAFDAGLGMVREQNFFGSQKPDKNGPCFTLGLGIGAQASYRFDDWQVGLRWQVWGGHNWKPSEILPKKATGFEPVVVYKKHMIEVPIHIQGRVGVHYKFIFSDKSEDTPMALSIGLGRFNSEETNSTQVVTEKSNYFQLGLSFFL